MNIFVTTDCPDRSARFLDDNRVNKMILESCQLMAGAIRVHLGKEHPDDLPGLYRISHRNHPCAVWIRQSGDNWLWVRQHTDALLGLYTDLRKRRHGCVDQLELIDRYWSVIPDGPLLPFQNSARNEKLGLDFTHLPVHQGYREYLAARWTTDKKPPTWTGRKQP